MGETDMKKVALITEYGNINIGNKLQNYAVKVLCENRGMEPVTFEYKSTYGKLTGLQKLIALIGVPARHAKKYRMILNRTKKFKQFSDAYLGKIVHVDMGNLDKDIGERYDLFLTGSDQVWHAADMERLNYFFLKFAPREKRGCISPSFGTDTIREDLKPVYREGLLGFDRLCCREEQGCRLIKELTGQDAELICDPTLLVEKKVWDDIAVPPQTVPKKKFILAYFLGSDPEINRLMSDYAKKNDLEIARIFSESDPNYYYITPNEFIYLMQNAAAVMTDSFHGTAFSIIYQKNFLVFRRKNADGKVTMNARIESVLKLLGLEKCAYDGGEVTEYPYDREKAMEALNREREKGNRWLDQYL